MADVKTYGAKGDGVTDDTAAFQAMWNDTFTKTGAGTVIVPDGKYVVTGRVGSLTSVTSAIVSVNGRGSTEIFLGANGGFDVTGQFVVEGFTFRPLAVVTVAVKTGRVDNNNGSRIVNNTWDAYTNRDPNKYFAVCADIYSSWFSVYESNVIKNGQAHVDYRGTGFRFWWSVNISFVSNSILGCEYGYLIKGDRGPDGNQSEGHMLIGNGLIANRYQFVMEGGLLAILMNNILDLTGPNGATVLNYATNFVAIGNWFAAVAGAGSGIGLWNSDRHVVSNNVFAWNSQSNGIMLNLQNSHYSIVSGNTFLSGSQGFTSDSNCSDLVVYGNTFVAQGQAAVNLSGVSNLTYFGNITQQPAYLPASYNGAGGPPVAAGPASYAISTVVVSQQTANAQDFSFSLPAGRFSSTPVATVTPGGDMPFPVDFYHKFDSSNANTIVWGMRRTDGGPIPQGNAFRVNIHVQANG